MYRSCIGLTVVILFYLLINSFFSLLTIFYLFLFLFHLLFLPFSIFLFSFPFSSLFSKIFFPLFFTQCFHLFSFSLVFFFSPHLLKTFIHCLFLLFLKFIIYFQIFKLLNPRLILSGHTHHGCYRVHENGTPEWTVSSLSWRNKVSPTFLLVSKYYSMFFFTALLKTALSWSYLKNIYDFFLFVTSNSCWLIRCN